MSRSSGFVDVKGELIVALPSNITFAEMYERFLVEPLFRPFAENLLERARPTANDSVLDIACGTGIVARLARKRLGAAARVVGVDVSGPMLAVARGIDATIDWREGNATTLPVPADEQFSVVTCHQGLQFVPEKANAVREMRRVLRSGGRAVVGTWLAIEDIPFMRDLDQIARQQLGPFTDSRHSFGDGRALTALLGENGFHDVTIETVSHDVRVPDGPLFVRMNAMAVVGMSPKGKPLDEAGRAQLAGDMATACLDVMGRYTKDGVLTFALTTNVATAQAR
jgi:ubiquinone/menaquinone biosynthesis C-methylase UbiE